MSLIVAAKASGRTLPAVAVERQHVVAARRTVPEHEDLAPAFGAQVDEVVAGAAQKAGEIEVACLERGFVARHVRFPVQLTLHVLLKKRELCAADKDALERDLRDAAGRAFQAGCAWRSAKPGTARREAEQNALERSHRRPHSIEFPNSIRHPLNFDIRVRDRHLQVGARGACGPGTSRPMRP